MHNQLSLLESLKLDGVVLSGINRDSILAKNNSDLDILLPPGSIEQAVQKIGSSADVLFDYKSRSPQHVLALLKLGGVKLGLLDLFGIYNFVDKQGFRWRICDQLRNQF